LRARVEGVERRIAAQDHGREAARTAESYLLSLRDRIEDVEHDPASKREMVRLLVSEIIIGRNEEGHAQVNVTYRFGPPDDGKEAEPELPEEELPLVTGNRSTPASHLAHTAVLSRFLGHARRLAAGSPPIPAAARYLCGGGRGASAAVSL
jgi:hypothetical protein